MDRVPLFACLHVTLRGCTSCGCMLCKQGVYYPPRVRERASLAYAGVACGVRFVAPSCAPVALMRVVRLRFRDCLRKDCVCFDARGCDFPRSFVKIAWTRCVSRIVARGERPNEEEPLGPMRRRVWAI